MLSIKTALCLSLALTCFLPQMAYSQNTAKDGNGIKELWQALQEHFNHLKSSNELETRRKQRIKAELAELVAYKIRTSCLDSIEHLDLAKKLVDDVYQRKQDPHTAAQSLIKLLNN